MFLNIYIQYKPHSNRKENILQVGYIKSMVEEFIRSCLIAMCNGIQNEKTLSEMCRNLQLERAYRPKNSHTIMMMKNLQPGRLRRKESDNINMVVM
jgi:hypothetical protein